MEDKTMIEWAEHFPPDIRQKFLNNISQHDCSGLTWIRKEAPSSYSALTNGFPWDKTPEGDRYWRDVRDLAEEGEFDSIYFNIDDWILIDGGTGPRMKNGVEIYVDDSISTCSGLHLKGLLVIFDNFKHDEYRIETRSECWQYGIVRKSDLIPEITSSDINHMTTSRQLKGISGSAIKHEGSILHDILELKSDDDDYLFY